MPLLDISIPVHLIVIVSYFCSFRVKQLYLIILIVLSLYRNMEGTRSTMNYKRFGLLAISQFPLLFVLSMKNSPLNYITGVGYERLNFIHRTVGRMIFALGKNVVSQSSCRNFFHKKGPMRDLNTFFLSSSHLSSHHPWGLTAEITEGYDRPDSLQESFAIWIDSTLYTRIAQPHGRQIFQKLPVPSFLGHSHIGVKPDRPFHSGFVN